MYSIFLVCVVRSYGAHLYYLENYILAQFNMSIFVCTRLLPNRSPVAWGSQRIALGALIFHSNTFHFIHVLYVGLLSSQRLALRAPFLGSSLGALEQFSIECRKQSGNYYGFCFSFTTVLRLAE